MEDQLLDETLECRRAFATIVRAVGETVLHEFVKQFTGGDDIALRRSFRFDKVHLLDAHAGNIRSSADFEVGIVALGGTELDIDIVFQRCEVCTAVGAATLVRVEIAVGIEPRMLAEILVVDLVVEGLVNGTAYLVSVSPRLLVTDVGLEVQQVGNVVAGERQAPDPRFVCRRTIETGRRILPLCLGQGCATARGDGFAGILCGLLVSIGIVVGSTAFQISTCLEPIDHSQTGRVGICRRVIGKVCRRLFEVGEDHFLVDVSCRRTGIGLSFGLGRGLSYDRYGKAEHSVCGRVFILLELIETYQVEVERSPVSISEAEDMLGCGRESFRVDGADDVVGRLDPSEIVVPGQEIGRVVLCESIVGAPLAEPVVARIARYGHVACC